MSYDAAFVESLRTASATLPEGAEHEAYEVFDRILEWERRLVLTDPGVELPLVRHYLEGTATFDDEVRVLEGTGPALVTAEHATDVRRKKTGVVEDADHGTGALAAMLHDELHSTSLIPLGRQTGNANVNPEHPVKDQMRAHMPRHEAHVALHGMIPGKKIDVSDDTEIHGLLGLGAEPNEQSIEVAERIVATAKQELGLRVLISNYVRHIKYDAETNGPLLDDDGQLVTGQLAAKAPATTINYAYRLMQEGRRNFPAVQIELTRGLRLVPEDKDGGWKQDRKAKVMGVYSGYLLTKLLVESASL